MNSLVSSILCPSCGGKLKGNTRIVCTSCKMSYPIADGVLNLLDDRVFHDSQNEHQKTYYDKEYLDEYANTQFEWRNRYIKRVLPFLPKNRSSVILDAACGQGYISIALAEMGYSVIACDLSVEGLKHAYRIAKAKHIDKRILFVASDVTKLRLRKNAVRSVILLHVIEHLKHDKEAVASLLPYCQKGGTFIIGVPLSYAYVFPLFIPMYYYSDIQVGHYRHYSIEQLSGLFGNRAQIRQVYYTGHLIKLVGALLSLFRISRFDILIEDMDEWFIQNKFWASNLMAIFQKK